MAGTIEYKGFTLNTPGTAAPWGQTEFDLLKDIIDQIESLVSIDPGEIVYGSSQHTIAHSAGLTYSSATNLIKVENQLINHLGAELELSKRPASGVIIDNDVISRIYSTAEFAGDIEKVFEIKTEAHVDELLFGITKFIADAHTVMNLSAEGLEINPDASDANFIVHSEDIANSFLINGKTGLSGFCIPDELISGIENHEWDGGIVIGGDSNSYMPISIGKFGNNNIIAANLYPVQSTGYWHHVIQGVAAFLTFGSSFQFAAAESGNADAVAALKTFIACQKEGITFNSNDLNEEFRFKIYFHKEDPEYTKAYINLAQVLGYTSVGSQIGGILCSFDLGSGGGETSAVIPLFAPPA